MRVHILPFFLGFALLGALSHEAVNRIYGSAPSNDRMTAPASPHQAGTPRQLRALDLNDSHDSRAIAPLPAFVLERDGTSVHAWAI